MKRVCMLWFVVLAGCSGEVPYQPDSACPGGGEQVLDDADEFCVFVITETGFLCPERLPNDYAVRGTGVDDFGVCSGLADLVSVRVRNVATLAVADGEIAGQAVDGGVLAPKVDVLWVVDNSGSMCEEQQLARQDAAQFLATLDDAGVDYQVGVITTDVDELEAAGQLRTTAVSETGPSCTVEVDLSDCPESLGPILASGDGDGIDRGRDLGCLLTQGTSGTGFEAGLAAAQLATSPALMDGANSGFLRPGADLALVFLSDENDCSTTEELERTSGSVCEWSRDQLTPVEDFVAHFRALKPGREIIAAAIVAPDDGIRYDEPDSVAPSCSSATGEAYSGYRYQQFAESFDGATQNLCVGVDAQGVGSLIVNGLSAP